MAEDRDDEKPDAEAEENVDLDQVLSEQVAQFGEEGAGEEAETSEQAPASDDDSGAQETESQSDDAAAEEIAPPDDWPKEDRERFQQLPNEARQLALVQYKRMQADYTRKTQALADDTRLARQLKDEVIDDDVRQDLHANGMDEAQGVRQLVQMHKWAKNDPAGYVRHVAQQAGLDAEAVLNGDEQPAAQQTPQTQEDPRLQKLQEQVQTLTQTEQQRQHQALQQQIESFRQEADENGEPKRPHFDEVQGEMVRILNAGLANGLDDAYDKAVWADPNIRQKVLERQQQAQAANQTKQQAADKAKRSGRNPRGQPATPDTAPTTADLDSIIGDEIARNL